MAEAARPKNKKKGRSRNKEKLVIEPLSREHCDAPAVIPYTKEECEVITEGKINPPEIISATLEIVEPKNNHVDSKEKQEDVAEEKSSLSSTVSATSENGKPVDNLVDEETSCGDTTSFAPTQEEEENSSAKLDFIAMKHQLRIISGYSELHVKEQETANEQELKSLARSVSMAQVCEEPSAPADFSYNYGISQINIELPVDREVEEVKFPLLFKDCVNQVIQDQLELGQQKTFTVEQLGAFYENPLLEREAAIVESFLDSQKNLEVHTLFEFLTRYMRCRLALKSTLEELGRLNKEIEALASSQLWTIESKKIVGYGDCSDGRRVKAQDEYPVAHFNSKALAQLARQLKQLRETIQEKLALEVYESQLWKLRVDSLILRGEQPLHGSVSVLFAFLRRPMKDPVFVEHLKFWLSYVTNSLLQCARKEEYLFIAHHVLRCPAGLVRWAQPYIQTPYYDPYQESDNSHHVDVVISLLDMVCRPIASRKEFLRNWIDPDQSDLWVWLDSDGDDEDADPEAIMELNDDDLFSLLNQIPVANVFRFIFRMKRRDGVDALSDAALQPVDWLRAFAVSRHLLRIFESGLRTYHTQRYRYLSKKLGQLVLHTVCSVADLWLHCADKGADGATMDRLLREYEQVMVEGLSILIRTRQQRSWQLLSRMPLFGLTERIRFQVWLCWHSEITEEPVDPESIACQSFWNLVASKLVLLPEPDWFVFLNTMAAMVTDGGCASGESGRRFLQLVAWELTQLGLLDDVARELCFKTANELLVVLADRYPPIVSFVLERLQMQLDRVDSTALLFFKDLPLLRWHPTAKDVTLLRDWLLHSALDTIQHQLAVTVLTLLNWNLEEGMMRPALGWRLHQDVALILVEAVEIHGRNPVSSVPVLPHFVADSVQFLSSFSRSWNGANLVQWAWQLVLKLRLHVFDCYPNHLPWMLIHPHKAFASIRQLEDDPSLLVIRQSLPAPLASFVALSMTSVGHSVPEFTSVGLDLLVALSAADQQRAVVAVLYNILPLFVTCPEVLYVPKFLSVVQNLIQADLTYYKRAKNLLAAQFPGTILTLVASLVDNSIWKLNGCHMKEAASLVEIWLNLLTRLPKWNADKSVLFLLNVLARIGWLQYHDTLKSTISTMLNEANVYRPSKGLASRVGNWVTGSGESSGHGDVTELIGLSPTLPYLSWLVLELELERQGKMWQLLLTELQPGKTKTLEQSLKSAASALKMPAMAAHQLCLVRYGQMAADMSMEHPLLPVVIQRFFSLYLGRPDVQEIGVQSWAVGQLIMTSCSSLSALLKRLALGWKDAMERFNDVREQPVGATSFFLTSAFFHSCCLWLDDVKLLEPNVYLPSLGPAYNPARLVQLFQGSELWLELCHLDAIEAEGDKVRHLLMKQKNPPASSVSNKHPSRPLRPTLKSLFHRLDGYGEPVGLSPVVLQRSSQPVTPSMFHNVAALRRNLGGWLCNVSQTAERFQRQIAELTALDCQFAELVAEQYITTKVEKQLAVECGGTQSGGSCTGAAVIRLAYPSWKFNAGIRPLMDSNRLEASQLQLRFQDATVESLCVASVLLDDCVDHIRQSTQQHVLDTGAALFYILVEMVNEDTGLYLPAKQLLSTCIEGLGQRCIAGQPEQCRNLVALLSSNANLAGMVAPHFTPSTPHPSPDAIDAFVDCYRLVTSLSKNESDLQLVLLTKFDIRWWLNCEECRVEDRSRLLEMIAAALESYGLEPAEKSLAVHEVKRRHWQQIVSHNFPEQYHRAVQLLLKSSETQSCSALLWCDLINTLGQGYLNLTADTRPEEFRQQVLQYTTQQSLLDINQLMETAAILSVHFSRERQLHGLYGLYPKYRPYVAAVSSLLLMVGHSLCFATLQNDVGTPSDLLVGRLWATIRDLYSPWILPYTQQQISSNCASWIQQLSSDRKLLLPWISADSALAATMVNSLSLCVHFVHETIPARQSILSHLLTFYLHGYCHAAVKPHILQVMHAELETLPWQSFVPWLSDVEQLVRVTSQFLPEVHAFLVSLWVRCPVAALMTQWKSTQHSTRFLACLLHLYVRLAGEPTAQQNGAMKRALEEACHFPWNYIDANVYDQVLNWYVSTCDPLFILQPYMQRTDPDTPSNDALVFRLLQSASGYWNNSSEHVDRLTKRQMFIRSWIRLVSHCASRHRSAIQQHPAAVSGALTALLEFITQNNAAPEYSSAVQEYLQAASGSSSCIADELSLSLCRWMSSRSNPALVETVIKVAVRANGDFKRVAVVMETALESYDGADDALLRMLPADATHQLVADCWKQEALLTWYYLVRRRGDVDDDPLYHLQQLLSDCTSLNLNDRMEPKLCLIYDRAISLLASVTSGTSTSALEGQWAALLTSWAQDTGSWLSSIGLGKTARLSSKGRCLALVMSCVFDRSAGSLDQLQLMGSNRHYADCKTVVDIGVEELSPDANNDVDDARRAAALLRRLLPHLYAKPFLTRLFHSGLCL